MCGIQKLKIGKTKLLHFESLLATSSNVPVADDSSAHFRLVFFCELRQNEKLIIFLAFESIIVSVAQIFLPFKMKERLDNV